MMMIVIDAAYKLNLLYIVVGDLVQARGVVIMLINLSVNAIESFYRQIVSA
jgi:hypothetical protein